MLWEARSSKQQEISVLVLEDNPADAKLMLRELQKAKLVLQHELVRSAEDFRARASAKRYDLVLADFNVPGWNGLEAIRWLRTEGYNTPVILVTGSLGDEQAVTCIKEGASDYVLKDKIEHLPIAVSHALEEQQLRAARDRALAELRQAAEQYELLFNSISRPTWVYDRETFRFLAVNDAAVQHYGYSREEFLAMTIKDIRPPEEIPRLLLALADTSDETTVLKGTWKHRKKNGDIIHVEITEGPLWFGGRPAVLITVEDVTERRVLEQQFLQAQKMEAVGRLAGGVAHDFNNLLMVMSSSAQLIQDDPDNKKSIDKYANQICHAAEKAASLTRQLLAFSRQQVMQPAIIDLNGVVRDIGTMLPRVLGEDVRIAMELAHELDRTNADRSQVEQIIMNLAVNARDAMPEGGTLTIQTKNVELDQEYVNAHGVRGKPGAYVMLSISDTGMGMSQEVQSHIFEPFFTTKELGKGTGLGLATVYGIVKQSGGWIWVYSEIGNGSVFRIYLPSSRQEPLVEQKAPEPIAHHGTETVLLVEDEEMLRKVTAEYLQRRGYQVLQAESGPQAQQILEQHEGDIDVLITDVVMPGFAGTKLAELCLAKRPLIRIMIVSGYADRTTHHEAVAGAVYLQKPFSLNTLAQRLRSLMTSGTDETPPNTSTVR